MFWTSLWLPIKDIFIFIKNLFSNKAKIHSLKQENSNLKKEFSAAQATIMELQKELSKHSDRKTFLSNYSYSEKTGISKNRSTDKLCCSKCLNDKLVESPLRIERSGWICIVCDKHYPNPDYISNLPRQADSDYDVLSS